MATLDPNGNTPIGTIVCWHDPTIAANNITATIGRWEYVPECESMAYLFTNRSDGVANTWVCANGNIDFSKITIGACLTSTQPVTVSNLSWAGENVTGRVCIAPTSLSCTKNINDSDISGLEVGCCATIVLTRQATFDLKVNYKKNGVAKTYTIANISHAAGTVAYGLIHENVFWEVANYTDLVVTAQNIR